MLPICILLPGARTAAIARIGYNSWRGLYSRISLTGLAVGAAFMFLRHSWPIGKPLL